MIKLKVDMVSMGIYDWSMSIFGTSLYLSEEKVKMESMGDEHAGQWLGKST